MESGETRAHTYHWLANLQALGRVDTSIWADRASVAVFDDNGARTYVYYNATCGADSATFSDGTVIATAARTLTAHQIRAVDRTWPMGNCTTPPPPSCGSLPGSGSGTGPGGAPGPGDPLDLYLGGQVLSTLPRSDGTASIPMAVGQNIAQLPNDPTGTLNYEITGLHAALQSGGIRFELSLNATTVANAVHLRIRIDSDGDSQDDYTAIHHYFPVDAAASTWEPYTEAQGLLSEQGTLSDLIDGSVRIQLWSAFGNGEVELDQNGAQLELPDHFTRTPATLPALTPLGLVTLALLFPILIWWVGRTSEAWGAYPRELAPPGSKTLPLEN